MEQSKHETPSGHDQRILKRPETWQQILEASETWEPEDQRKLLLAMIRAIEDANNLGDEGLEPGKRELRIIGELSEVTTLCLKYSEFCTNEYYFEMFFELLGLRPSFARRGELYEKIREPDYPAIVDTIDDPEIHDIVKTITQRGTIYMKPIGVLYTQVRQRLESLGMRLWG